MDNVMHCRLCADVVNGGFRYIFSPDDEGFGERINACLPITVKKTDPLPKQVCQVCVDSFDRYQHFYFRVLDAEKRLKAIWRQTKVSNRGSVQCIDCPLCTDGSVGIKDGRILLGNVELMSENEKNTFGHVDNECLAQMIRQELNKEERTRAQSCVESSKEQAPRSNFEFMCYTCGEGYNTEEDVMKHICLEPPPPPLQWKEEKTEEEEEKGEMGETVKEDVPAQCEICGKKYKNRKRLSDHLRFCHPSVYHKCEVCDKKFPKKWLLTTHMRKHTGELPYKCPQCSKGFISNSYLRNHINFHHRERDLTCTVCRANGFYTKQDLNNHVRTKHTKERIFHCGTCSKSFMSSGVYYQHRLIHTDIRKYPCSYCSKSFRRWLALQNHVRIHNGERPFTCDECGRSFRQRGDMKKHRARQHDKADS